MNKINVGTFILFFILIFSLFYINAEYEKQLQYNENLFDLLFDSYDEKANLYSLNYNQKIIIRDLKEEHNKILKDNENYKDIISYKDEMLNDKFKIIMKPTYHDVITFLKNDYTDERLWLDDYDCTQFSNTLIRNAKKQHIYSCFVEINMENLNNNKRFGHAIVAFNTVDKGIIYIEPQSDSEIHLGAGLNYGKTFKDKEDDLIIIGYDSCFERVLQ